MSERTGSAVKGLRACKRYIATHDSSGKSVYAEAPAQRFDVIPIGGMARSYAVGSVPAVLAGDVDVNAYKADEGRTSYKRREIVVRPGANLVVVDLKPGGVSAMHRTVSLDFSICVAGEIDHELDGGEKVRLYPGVRRRCTPSTLTLALTCVSRTILYSAEQCIGGRTHRAIHPRGSWRALFLANPSTSPVRS